MTRQKIFLFKCIVYSCLVAVITSIGAVAQTWKTTLIDSFPKGGQQSGFSKAAAIDLDFQGNIYILDRGRHELLKFSPAMKQIHQTGGFGEGESAFDDPADLIANTPLDIFVADYQNRRVVRFDKQLNFLSELHPIHDAPFEFERVLSVAISPQYDLFLLEDRDNRIIKFSRFSDPTVAFGGLDDPYGQLLEPTDLTLDGSKRLFVADPGQSAVIVFDYLGNFLHRIEHPDFMQPRALYYGGDDQLFIIDSEARRIFIYRNGRQFQASIDMKDFQGRLTAISVSGRTTLKLFVLSTTRCYIFSVHK